MTSLPVVRDTSTEFDLLSAEFESLSYSISHDLRAPVRAVEGFARALEEDYGAKLDDEGRRLLAVVQGEAARMGTMIDDLLAISRLGRQPMVRTRIDMAGLVNGVAAEQTAAAGQLQSIVEVGDLVATDGDLDLLRVVWGNLIDNAIKYSSKQEQPRVRVWSTHEVGRVVYHVSDNGVGFDMQYAGKLFGAFQRLHNSPDFPGSGVGLAQAQRIVHRHRGTIWADGHPEAGATFSFGLPFGGEK